MGGRELSRLQKAAQKRRPNDFYETPDWAIQVLIDRMPESYFKPSIMEPCVGDGAIARLFEEKTGAFVHTNDLDPKRPAMTHYNAAAAGLWELPRLDWVITNPPFVKAIEIAVHAVPWALKGVCLYLRLSFLEPTGKRADWLFANPPTRMIVLPRISFTGDGHTDSVTGAWMVWSDLFAPGIEIVSNSSNQSLQKRGYTALIS